MNACTPDAAQDAILRAVLDDLSEADAPVREAAMGGHLVAVTCGGRTGLASRQGAHGPGRPALGGDPAPRLPESARDLAGWLLAPPPDVPEARALGLAAVNALLPPPDAAASLKGQDLIRERGTGRRVVVVGHFPFVERMGPEFESLHVLELAPRPGDLAAERAADVLPRADVAAVTGTTLLNGTLAGILSLCREDAFVLLLGPSAPFAPSLFPRGVDALAGSVVLDAEAALADVRKGLPFKALRGASSLVWTRD